MRLSDSGEGVVPIPRIRNRVQIELPIGAVLVHVRHEPAPLRASPLYTGLRHDHHPLSTLGVESNSGASPPYIPVPSTIVLNSLPRALSLTP